MDREMTPIPVPGEAVRRMLELRARLARIPSAADAPTDVSSRVKDYLYGTDAPPCDNGPSARP